MTPSNQEQCFLIQFFDALFFFHLPMEGWGLARVTMCTEAFVTFSATRDLSWRNLWLEAATRLLQQTKYIGQETPLDARVSEDMPFCVPLICCQYNITVVIGELFTFLSFFFVSFLYNNAHYGKKSFGYRGACIWNKLPEDLREPKSMNLFKSKLDRLLLSFFDSLI